MPFAFNYIDLQANQCTQTPNLADTVILDNDIHPLFQQRSLRVGVVTNGLALFYNQDPRWKLDTDIFPLPLYARILPAVRLASLMLEKSLPFMHKLMHAAEIPHPLLPGHTYLDPTNTLENVDIMQTRQNLLDLAGNIRFYSSNLGRDEPSPSGDRWQGIVYSALRSEVSLVPQLCIGISQGYLDFFAGDRYVRASPEQRLRTNFMLARLMMHELAHAVRQWRNLNTVSAQARQEGRGVSIFGGPSSIEPWYGDVTLDRHDAENELGRAWEDWFFGCLVKPIGMSRDYSVPFGFCTVSWVDWFEDRQHDEINTKPIHTALTAESISRLFDKRTWDTPGPSQSGITLSLTPLKAIMIGVNGFDRGLERLMRTAESQRWTAANL